MEPVRPSAPEGDDLARAAHASPSPTAEPAARQTLPRRLRLQRRREFLRVQRSGVKHHTRFFLVFVAPSALRGRAPDPVAATMPGGTGPGSLGGLPGTRLGVTVTRKVGKAVKRNRIKRLVREAFRREHHALPAGLDMVWVAKRDAIDTTYEAVIHDMRALAQRLHASPGRPRPGAGRRGHGTGPASGGTASGGSARPR